MKKTILTIFTFLLSLNVIQAAEIGFIDYNKVVNNYNLSKSYKKELNQKLEEYKKLALKREKEVLEEKDTTKRAKIEKTAVQEINKKQKEYMQDKTNKEITVIKNIEKASEKVKNEKKLDIILRKEYVVTGGIDCTNDVIKILNAKI